MRTLIMQMHLLELHCVEFFLSMIMFVSHVSLLCTYLGNSSVYHLLITTVKAFKLLCYFLQLSCEWFFTDFLKKRKIRLYLPLLPHLIPLGITAFHRDVCAALKAWDMCISNCCTQKLRKTIHRINLQDSNLILPPIYSCSTSLLRFVFFKIILQHNNKFSTFITNFVLHLV